MIVADRVLVTGASGVVGGATTRALATQGFRVRALQRRALPDDLRELGVEEIRGDLLDHDALRRACADVDVVVHAAARVEVTGPWSEFERVNIEGTQRILAAAAEAGAGGFVLVSSPSVAHSGSALVAADADPADPDHAGSHYSRSKAIAEQHVLGHTGPMATVAIRPHLVWGPGDTQLTARIIDRARSGKLVLIGDGAALVDTTYLDNAADSLVAAVQRVSTPEVRGRAFVVSNGQPRTVAEMVTRIAQAAGAPGPRARIPYPIARFAGHIVAAAWERSGRTGDPVITPFLAEQLATAHWFDQCATQAALDWRPRVSIDEGFALLHASLRRGVD
jgi:2-alkyl-3-oxoalkanoate reductase